MMILPGETVAKTMPRRVQEGCRIVEMEAAALLSRSLLSALLTLAMVCYAGDFGFPESVGISWGNGIIYAG
jgi:hypothetical protein